MIYNKTPYTDSLLCPINQDMEKKSPASLFNLRETSVLTRLS
jgi:hypothetical protein